MASRAERLTGRMREAFHIKSPSDSTREISTQDHIKAILVMLWTHLRRCFGWRLNLIEPTAYETNLFENANIETTTLRSYLAWRRSQMLCSVPVLMSAAVTGLSKVDSSNERTEEGNFVYNLPNIANFILAIAVLGAIGVPTGKLRVWLKWRLSSKIMRIGFIISFILPLIPAIIPLQYLAKESGSSTEKVLRAVEGSQDSIILLGIKNFVSILPVLISFPSALLAGSLRIRGLLPHSSLSSWILVTTAPFLSIVNLAAATLIIQYVGDVTLLLGVFFRCLFPWLYVFRRALYVKEPNEDREKKLDRWQMIILITNLTGIGLIIYWIFTEEVMKTEELPSHLKFVLEIWGRILATTVVSTDMLLRMTITNWREGKSSCMEMDDVYKSIERIIGKEKSSDDNVSINSGGVPATTAAMSQSMSMEEPDRGAEIDLDASNGAEYQGTKGSSGEELDARISGFSHPSSRPDRINFLNNEPDQNMTTNHDASHPAVLQDTKASHHEESDAKLGGFTRPSLHSDSLESLENDSFRSAYSTHDFQKDLRTLMMDDPGMVHSLSANLGPCNICLNQSHPTLRCPMFTEEHLDVDIKTRMEELKNELEMQTQQQRQQKYIERKQQKSAVGQTPTSTPIVYDSIPNNHLPLQNENISSKSSSPSAKEQTNESPEYETSPEFLEEGRANTRVSESILTGGFPHSGDMNETHSKISDQSTPFKEPIEDSLKNETGPEVSEESRSNNSISSAIILTGHMPENDLPMVVSDSITSVDETMESLRHYMESPKYLIAKTEKERDSSSGYLDETDLEEMLENEFDDEMGDILVPSYLRQAPEYRFGNEEP
mmetsp:Transcript_43527/g.74283  ORF Transcript_43527/g.74283 Transcript_43527/m.74283 type:complete len:833 (-) Transcript_43527:173-2671(-)